MFSRRCIPTGYKPVCIILAVVAYCLIRCLIHMHTGRFTLLNTSQFNTAQDMEEHLDNIKDHKFFNMYTLSKVMTTYLKVKRPARVYNNRIIAIGIPSVRRQNSVIYIVNTIKSLLSNLPRNETKRVLIVPFIAEPSTYTFALNLIQLVTSKLPDAVRSGLIEFVYPRLELYPDVNNLKSSFRDSKTRIVWRTKEVLDGCIVMLYSLFRGQYFLFLEDDIVAQPDYFYQIQRLISINKKDWFAAKLAPYSKGPLFIAEKLWMIIEYLLLFHDDKPIVMR